MEQSTYKKQYEAKKKKKKRAFSKLFKTLQGKVLIFVSWINNAIWQGHLKAEIELQPNRKYILHYERYPPTDSSSNN